MDTLSNLVRSNTTHLYEAVHGHDSAPSSSRSEHIEEKDENEQSPWKVAFSSPSFLDFGRRIIVLSLSTIYALSIKLISLFPFLAILAPSFITSLLRKRDGTFQPRKVSSTAYLNGLRGVAAYVVFWFHFGSEFYSREAWYGYHSRPGRDKWLLQLPIISVALHGMFCVAIFFILSGFVLSYKPLQLVRAREHKALLKCLASSVFRRGPRLFLPCIPPLVFAALCLWIGVYDINLQHKWAGRGLWDFLKDAFWSFETLLNFSIEDQRVARPETDPPLYTLPREYMGSIVTFLAVLGLSRVKARVRIGILSFLCVYCFYHVAWQTYLFLAGIIIAELRLIRQEAQSGLPSNTAHPSSSTRTTRCIWIGVLITALFLGSTPQMSPSTTFGYSFLTSLVPTLWLGAAYGGPDHYKALFWCCIAAPLLLLSLENYPALQRPFTSRFVQYLGDISFSLYVFHVPFILTLGRPVTYPMMRWFESRGLDSSWGWMMAGILLSLPLFWLSEVQMRVADDGSIRAARWLEGLVMDKEDGEIIAI